MRPGLRALSLWLALWLAVPVSLAAPPKRFSVTWSGGGSQVAFSLKDFMTPEVSARLKTGLPQTLVTRLYAYPPEGIKPLAVTALSCRVVYDLWEDVYRVERTGAQGSRRQVVKDVAKVADHCLQASAVPLGNVTDYQPVRERGYYLAALVELNPVSPDTVARIRRWLARPGGGQLESDAFFGSFVSIFVNRHIGAAERTVSYRSRALKVPR